MRLLQFAVYTCYIIMSGWMVLWGIRLTQPRPTRIEPTMLVVSTSVLLALCAAGVLAVWLLQPRTWLAPVGLLLCSAGIWIRHQCVQTLGDQFTCDLRVPTRMIYTGWYRYLRHPSYVACVWVYTGIGLLWGSWPAAVLLGVSTAVIYTWRSRIESRLIATAVRQGVPCQI